MIKNIFIAVFTFVILAITGCDEVEKPYLRDGDGGSGGDTGTIARKVLIEDFTGHKCVNCPEAHQVVEELKAEFGEDIVAIAVHAGTFAEPSSSGDYTADYRTAVGNELNNTFDVQFYPSGTLNRKENATVYSSKTWKQEVRAMMGQEAIASIEVTPVYEDGTAQLGADVDVTFTEVPGGQVNVCVFVTESGIISAQKNDAVSVGPVPDIFDYEHKHMLRGSMNGTWGEPVTSETIEAETTYTKNYTGFSIADHWDPANMSIVAFIYDQTTQEVLQVEEVHL